MVYCLKICIFLLHVLNKSETIINAVYWVLSEVAKNNNNNNKQSVLIAKISSCKTQKIANPQKFHVTR